MLACLMYFVMLLLSSCILQKEFILMCNHYLILCVVKSKTLENLQPWWGERGSHSFLITYKNRHSFMIKITSIKAPHVHFLHYSQFTVGSGVGFTEDMFVNCSVDKIFYLGKVPVRLFKSHIYLTGITTAELRWHLTNMNVIFNSLTPEIWMKFYISNFSILKMVIAWAVGRLQYICIYFWLNNEILQRGYFI